MLEVFSKKCPSCPYLCHLKTLEAFLAFCVAVTHLI